MIAPATLAEMLAADPAIIVQRAIVATLKTLMPGVAIAAHPGKVDLSELVSKSVVAAPGIGVGWSRVRRAMMVEGSYGAAVDWTAYIVAEAKAIDNKRVEKEDIGVAIGNQLLRILSDEEVCFWGRTGILPPSTEPPVEMKPFFTIRDAQAGTAYYIVTWTQILADIGTTVFPAAKGTVVPNPDGEAEGVQYADDETLRKVAKFWPAGELEAED